jgi:aminoglycoside phosphotransferase (APT) family kinase protein
MTLMTRMHADDEVHVDIPLVHRLLAKQFPQWASLPMKLIQPSGTDNAIYRLGDEMVVRFPRGERASHTLEKEIEWLPRLAPQLPVAIPIPKAKGAPAEGYPFRWSVYTWLKGENATHHTEDLNQMAVDLAGFVAALQKIDPSGGPMPGAHNFFRGVALSERDQMTRAAIISLGQAIDRDAVTAVWEAALSASEWGGPPVWVHGDLDPRNVLVAQGRLCAVIDFGGLSVGDPACDVMAAWKFFSSRPREVFRNKLSVDESTWIRSQGWALSQALIALSSYTEETQPALVREARRWMTEVLADFLSM